MLAQTPKPNGFGGATYRSFEGMSDGVVSPRWTFLTVDGGHRLPRRAVRAGISKKAIFIG